MKSADPTLLDRRYAAAQRVAWLLELSQPGWTWRGATLATTFGGDDYPAALGEIIRWREWLPDAGSEGGRARAEAELRVPGRPEDAGSLRAELETRAPVGIAATLRLAWLDPLGTDAASAATMLRGRVTGWSANGNGITLRLADELEAIGGRRIGRLLRATMLAGGADSTAIGSPLPWIFGSLADAELAPLRVGATTRLAAPIDAATTAIPVVSLDGFPSSGLIQIGSEKILCGAIDAGAKTLGTALEPAARGIGAVSHRAGEIVRFVPPGEFLFLAADHPCKSIGAVFADGMPLAESEWQAIPLALGGLAVQAISLSSWPIGGDGNPAKRLSASVDGLTGDAGILIENPARAIELLLTYDRLGNLDADRIDSTQLDLIAADLDARGYCFARRLAGNETLGELLDGAAEEAGLWIQATDPIRLIAADPVPHAESAAEDLDATRMLLPAAPARVEAPAGLLPPDAVELIGASLSPGSSKPALLFPPERSAAGIIPRRFALQWLDLAAGSAAGDLGELRWRRLGEPPFVHAQPYPLGTALLSCGDTVRLSDAPLEMDESLGWLRSIELGSAAVGGLSRARAEVWGPWAGAYLWKYDRLNYIRRFAFGGHLLFVLAGRPIALLTRAGTLRIAGRLRERATIGGTQATAIALSGGWLNFAAGAAGVLNPFLRIDGDGNAELTGTLRERSMLTIDAAGQVYGADADRFWFSADAIGGALEWQVDAMILHLPGILIERVRL